MKNPIKILPRKSFSSILSRILVYIFLIGVSYIFLFPFLYMVVTSFKDYKDLYDFSVMWVPHKFHWQNYAISYELLDFWKYFKNSVLLTLFTTIGHMLSCSFIAYGFARYRFPGKNILFALLIAVIIVPPQTVIIPSYMLYSNFGWLKTYLPLIVPCFLGLGLKGGLFIYIFRQFFLNLPNDIENAAKIDGCTYIGTYFRIALPMSRSSLLVVGILSMVWHWNDYYEPSIYAPGLESMLLPQKTYMLIDYVENPPLDTISTFVSGEGNPINMATLMAGMVICLLPILIVFAFLQKGFMQGIERTGLVE